MLDIVFSDNACGSLKAAQYFGEGKYKGGGFGVVLGKKNATEEEIRQAQHHAEEEYRKRWESAQPMGGNPEDVYGFGLGLSVGDISEDMPGPVRGRVFCELNSFPLSLPGVMERIDQSMEKASKGLKNVLNRSADGEQVRLWYSNQPDEMCGFYWMTAQLDSLKDQCGPISMIKLPQYEQRDDGTIVTRNAWGDVSPGEWHKFLPLEQPMSLALRRSITARWRSLQEENAPFRAVLNGHLVSAPADFYDSFMRRELARASDEFHEAQIIGNIIRRFQLGIGAGLIDNRIETMINSGELEIVTQAPDDVPRYRRILRKVELHNPLIT